MDDRIEACHVLIVDQERLVRWYVGEVARDAGLLVTEAPDVASALDFARNEHLQIDLAFLNCPRGCADLALASALATLRPDARVILTTDRASEGFAAHARTLGVDQVLVKPINADIIRSIVQGCRSAGARRRRPYAPFRATIPRALRRQRDRIAALIAMAADEHGAVGQTAKDAAAVFQAHTSNEDRFALPPLGLLPLLAHGLAWPEMKPAIAMAANLESALPAILEEHGEIVAALTTVERAARRAGRTDLARLVVELEQLAEMEVEVLYPASIVAGKLLKHYLDGAAAS